MIELESHYLTPFHCLSILVVRESILSAFVVWNSHINLWIRYLGKKNTGVATANSSATHVQKVSDLTLSMVFGRSCRFEGMRVFWYLGVFSLLQFLRPCWCARDEGLALLAFRKRVEGDPYGALWDWGGTEKHCFWFGVGCSDSKVVSLEPISQRNILAPEVAQLGDLKLLNMDRYDGAPVRRKLMDMEGAHTPSNGKRKKKKTSKSPSPSPLPAPSLSRSSAPGPRTRALTPKLHAPSPSDKEGLHVSTHAHGHAAAPSSVKRLPTSFPVPTFSSTVNPSPSTEAATQTRRYYVLYFFVGLGILLAIGFAAIFIFLFRMTKVITVKPWVTGLSGQLQKAFVTGVPKLNRTELEIACEDFSNIIGNFQDGVLYKGTLSSGVEIAVVSFSVASAKDWSRLMETQFREKIYTLSKVNHKNFINLLGYCEEEETFTRMMIFEYASNGTLFEHIHVMEAEHLDWPARLRITMGIAYCLEHMHQLDPPMIHKGLHSAAIYLTDDFAAKIADFGFWNVDVVKTGSGDSGILDNASAAGENNVYNFGLILLEMMTGKLPYSEDTGPLVVWASDFLSGARPLKHMMDPTLTSFSEHMAMALCQIIRSCTNPDPGQRPTMKEVVSMLKEVTAIGPHGALPRLSPLWWAELEILSTDAS